MDPGDIVRAWRQDGRGGWAYARYEGTIEKPRRKKHTFGMRKVRFRVLKDGNFGWGPVRLVHPDHVREDN